MTTAPLTCPYCNAFIPASEGSTVGQRVPCPRCGEAFTVLQTPPRGSADLQTAPTNAPPITGVDLDVDRRLRMRRNNRIVAATVLGVMGLGAILGLSYALYSQPERRAHDTRMPHKPRGPNLTDLPTTPTATPPIALEALRWLPTDSTVVAGVQVAELRQTDAGRDLLNNLSHIGKLEIKAGLLEQWTGLKVEEVDHVVLGVKADDALPPRAVLVVRTLHPYNADAVRTTLHAEPLPDAGGKKLYKCKPRDGGLATVLWFADEQTLIFGLVAKHLEAVPDKPAVGLERLPAEVRTLLQNRLQAAGPAWVVGYAADWRKTVAAAFLTEKDADLLGRIHAFAVQLQAVQPTTLLASLQCDNADAAQALEKRLLAAKPAPDADWKAAREGSWLTLQLRGDPMAFFKDLGK
jgi:hypothetical protein